ncbi:superkiller protein [Histoplasma capsulatum G186AR]|uniref:Superkiller protein n=2 Tax=Ajellomyces capsulatus TaxID=5037 RepID=C0NAU5_AJECG|nr:superkiller protein [Histoplasma capsulatum G186AR]EEH10786.1 superkiller protein [Histoplasma capsulatum G186AR]KAG5288667.1 superkiller protein [Histoplasma capsulatum]QSS71242.1 superkiller protein [Histoplasma capsulatum G186AR]
MSAKESLKSIRACLDSKDFEQAAGKAKDLCDKDPQNYHAHLFLGLALDNLNDFRGAETSYLTATAIKDDDRTAWQGLLTLYEKQDGKYLDQYRKAVTRLCQILAATDDKARCQSAVQKYVELTKKHGSKAQYKQALELQLPSSFLYDILEGTVPHPSHTYLRIIEICEAEEKEFINREIGERRTRLGARIDQVTLEVKREAFQRSNLDNLCREIINWSNDDGARRNYEEKLLQRAYDWLQVLAAGKKNPKREEVQRLAREMVIIKHPFVLAWKIVLEWQDGDDLAELDINLLNDFIELFPEEGLSKVLKGFLGSDISPFPKELTSQSPKENNSNTGSSEANNLSNPEDRLLLMAEGLEQSPGSILAHRIMGQLYLSLDEFQTAVDVARKGIEVITEVQRLTGLKLRNATDAVNTTLANSLITYQSPKNHPEAKQIFEEMLNRRPTSTCCFLGIGLILEEDQDYAAAVDFLEQAMERDPTNLRIRSELFWCKAHNGELELGLHGLQETVNMMKADHMRNQDLRAEILYRIGYCQWELDPSFAARKDRTRAYASFLRSIQSNMNYAPAYSSLGIYYEDYKKDRKRARRCFHKAFEISTAEVDSAERLARDFANQGAWDIVETISQRVVDSGRAKPAPGSKRKGYSWPYVALGVVEISRQQYTKSIVAFQSALRISPDNYQSWVGLAESYHNSGRYVAATKAFEHAEMLELSLPISEREQVWFAKYMFANVKRELGEYEDAIARYEAVLNMKPDEFGVTIALLQTLTENAWKCVTSGLFGEAAECARKAVETGISIAQLHPDVFNLWKSIADSFSIFSWLRGKASLMPITEYKGFIESQADMASFEILADEDGVRTDFASLLTKSDSEDVLSPNICMHAAILAQKRAVSISATDKHAQAIAWYNLGWAEYRAYVCLQDEAKSKINKPFLKTAMRCFKRAIELEAGNSEFWNALGVVTTSLSPKVAQHSIVRSLHLNQRSPQAWTNLGALYLLHNDYELANEAFTRAQSTDPDFAHAWLGQGLLALLFGDTREARELFKHAFELGNSALTFPKKQYAVSVFDHLMSDTMMHVDIQQLIHPLFALHQLQTQSPFDLQLQHLSALLAERIGSFTDAASNLKNVCFGMEFEYEKSEAMSSLSRFAQAKSDAARVHLAQMDYDAAVDSAETALSLSSENAPEEFDPLVNQKIRLSSHLTAGLAYFYLKDMDRAIDMFRDALQEADSSPDVVCLLAQVLWAKGGEEEREAARVQLLDCIEKHPTHVGAVTLLGVIALLDADEDSIEAVESDLQEMRTSDDVSIHDRAKVTKLLSSIATLVLAKNPEVPKELRQRQEAITSIMLAPYQPQGWAALSTASSLYPAEIALQTALRNIPPNGTLESEKLCHYYTLTGRRDAAVRAIMIAPWVSDGWKELSHCISVE